jgi:hypothetical protein
MPSNILHVAIHDLTRKAENGFAFVVGKNDLELEPTLCVQRARLCARRASESHGKLSSDMANVPKQGVIRAISIRGPRSSVCLRPHL